MYTSLERLVGLPPKLSVEVWNSSNIDNDIAYYKEYI